jgi:aryl-alcohol dehydrogenase-like predicted oxidoreductase
MIDGSGALMVGSLHVRRLGFGTMGLTGPGTWGPPDAAIAVLSRAVDLGVDLIDTADSYGPDVSETLIAEALHPYPEGLVIATKAGMTRPGPGQWTVDGRPEHLRARCESSLTRLKVERIDLFQLHRVDDKVPADEQFGVLADLRTEGKVAEVGLSEVEVDQIVAAGRVVPVATVQNHYNIGHRGFDDVVDHCEREGIGFIPWFPLAGGSLARPGGPLDTVAHEVGATLAQVSLAWLLRRSPVMLPIPGTSSLEHLEENCAAGDVDLTDDQFDRLDADRKALRRWGMTA